MTDARTPGGPSPRRSVVRGRWALRLALVLALLALAVHVGWIPTGAGAGSGSYSSLHGTTDEQQSISVTLDHHSRIHAADVQLIGLCENGSRQSIRWSPESPRIPFRAHGSGIVAHEYSEQRSVGDIVSHTVAGTTARVAPGDQSAEGDLRYQTTFRYPDGRRLRCDSGYVHWAVHNTGAASTGKSTVTPGSFLPVSSLAVTPPPEQLRFASFVDRICAVSYDENQRRKLRGRRPHETSADRQEAAIFDHERQYFAIGRLGQPSSAAGLYNAWLTNMLERLRLEWLAFRQRAQGKTHRSEATVAEVNFMKVRGDSLGQEFGLRVCTSNGPLRRALGN